MTDRLLLKAPIPDGIDYHFQTTMPFYYVDRLKITNHVSEDGRKCQTVELYGANSKPVAASVAGEGDPT